ncbi:ABC transporter permease [Bacteroidia bacterium]|nr:ABC transporter permease [Bacteroidia bacterium]
MFKHYLNIAFRYMRKYKNQTIISIIGLAVGFTCFALATLWIRYELTYDSFHKDAKQMYVVYKPNFFSNTNSGSSRQTNSPLAGYLKEIFPEIEDATTVIYSYHNDKVIVEDIEYPAQHLRADSSLFQFFDVKIIEGSRDFLIPGSNQRAITQEKSRQLFGSENPIGKTAKDAYGEEFTICAVVSGLPGHSNYPFDFIRSFYDRSADPNYPNRAWFYSQGENTIIKLLPNTDVEVFKKKLYEHNTGEDKCNYREMTIVPLTQVHYLGEDVQREVKFQHILIFAVAGALVILCSLFNYLTLFISRFRIRQKEMALRRVCGASGRSLLAMLSVEFLLSLLLAVGLGGCLTQWMYKPFLQLADIQMSLPSICLELSGYVGAVILVALLVFLGILIIFQKRNLNASIRRSNKSLFRKTSVIIQLIISILFAFCTTVILKQMYFLHHTTELGFSFQNRATFTLYTYGLKELDKSVLENHIKQIPEITETLTGEGLVPLLPMTGRMGTSIFQWEDKPADVEAISTEISYVTPQSLAYYDFQLVEGEFLTEADPDSVVLINESAAKAFGWKNPVGKHVNRFSVKGVVKNVYNFEPTIKAQPYIYKKMTKEEGTYVDVGEPVMFKYEKGMWKSAKEKIEQLHQKEYAADYPNMAIWNAEEIYDNYLKSENALIKLLSIVSAVCLLICVFGFVSLVSLTCEERRKEIAVRKINGATSRTILSIFSREYFTLLIIGALIAFPAGYYIMHRWLEQYVRQTDISAWIYLAILAALALIIILCVGWQVYKASVENPADVMKSE